MKMKIKLKRVIAGLACAGALALSANAQALTFVPGAGDAANPIVITSSPANGLFLDTINFDLGAFTHFSLTSTVSNISFFGAPIFENNGDTQFIFPTSSTYLNVPLPDLGLPDDYHLHPQGLNLGEGSYQITMWGSTPAAVPVPAAIYLFGSGLIGLVGLARRKMKATA
jgi:hypothetical protein